MESLWRDLRFAARGLGRQRGLAAAIILLLALGLGGSTAMFSVVNGVLLEPLDYDNADRLVAIFRHDRERDQRRNPTTAADFLDWKAESESLERMTAAHPWAPSMTGRETPERLAGLKASVSLFDLLGAEAAIGRVFLPDDEKVVVLGHELWQRQFGGRENVLGEMLTLDGEAYEVVGVMPPGFAFPPFWATEAEFWAPLVLTEEQTTNRRSQFLRVFARLRDGRELDGARSELETLAGRLESEYPDTNLGASISVEPLREPVVQSVRSKLLVLFGAVGVVLLVTCANVAQLLLARVFSLRRDVTVRLSLGATRWDLAKGFLTESVLLSVLGAAAGLVMAHWAVGAIRALSVESLPRAGSISLDGNAFVFAAALALATGILFGTAPALASSRVSTVPTRFESRDRGRRFLIVVQVALALVLLVGSGLLFRSFRALDTLDPGFSREHLITMEIPFAGTTHEDPKAQNRLFRHLRDEVNSIPGVESAALVNHLPIGGDLWRTPFIPDGLEPESDAPRASFRVITPGFFRTFGARLEAGRSFDERDTADSAPVIIVNRTLADRYFSGRDPIGRRIQQGGVESTIVGVVSDMRQWTLTDDVRAEILFPYSQNPAAWWKATTLVIRSQLDVTTVARTVRARMEGIDGSLPLANVRTIDDILARDVRQPRLNASLLGAFAASAFLLVAIGVYGVVAHSMSQRRREIGVRAALGAAPPRIVALAIREAMRPVLLGVLLGGIGALASTRLLASFLFGVESTDPVAHVTALAAIVSVSLFASYLPARTASQRSPVEVLR